MIQGDLIAFIKAISGMIAKTTRVYWLNAPTGTALPYVVVSQVSGEIDVTHDGSSGLQVGRFQVDCYGASWADACSIRDLIEGAFKGYKGTMTSTTVDAVFPSNPIDFQETEVTPPIYRAIEDLEIHFRK